MSRQRPREVPVARDDEVTVSIDGFGDGPDSLGKFRDYVVFVPGALPGELANVRITSATRKFGRGELLSIERASPDRVEARCAHFLHCGGCHRQHQAYPAQLLSKQERLQRVLNRALGDDTVDVEATVAAAGPYGERHKVVAHLLHDRDGRLVAGLHRARSPELEAIYECPASDPLAWDLVERTIELLNGLPHRAWDPWFAPQELLRSVLVRTTTIGEAHLVLVATKPEVPGFGDLLDELHRAGATTISVNHNDGDPARLLGPHTERWSGPPFVMEPLAGVRYRIAPTSFFQTSPRMAEKLVEGVLGWLEPRRTDVVADLYCGVGLLTLPLAQRARTVFGIERNPHAVADARAAAADNGLDNVQFRAGHVAGWLAACRRGELPRPHLVAMDPPREGLGQDVVDELAQLRPERLAYVSCEPQTLVQDLQALHAAGFDVVRAVPFDMFPQTALVESLVCLEARR
jgi:23S rRNA (uracil1939-C5)-methyltransferase